MESSKVFARLTASLALLLAAPGWATSVLMVPRTEAARPVCEGLVEVFTAQKLTVKMAGTKSTAIACLKRPQAERGPCFLEAAKKSRVDGIVLIAAVKKGKNVSLTMELLSKVTGKPRATQKLKSPVKTLKKKANTAVQGLVVEMLLEDGPAPTGTGGAVAALDEEAVDPDELAPLTVTPPEPAPEPEPVAVAPTPPPEPVVAPPKPVVRDVPKVVTLTPPPKETPVVVAPGPARGSAAPAIAVTGVAVAAAAAAAVFGGLALAGKSQLERAPDGVSPLSYQQAVDLQAQTNTNFTIALGAGIGAGVSAGVAAWLWAAR